MRDIKRYEEMQRCEGIWRDVKICEEMSDMKSEDISRVKIYEAWRYMKSEDMKSEDMKRCEVILRDIITYDDMQ